MSEASIPQERGQNNTAEQQSFEAQYFFSSGEQLHATEDSDGIAHIVIRRGDEIVIDFEKLLPPGYRFVCEKYVRALEKKEGKEIWYGWYTNFKHKTIELEPFEGIEDILGLLHEIGHARFDEGSPELAREKKIYSEIMTFAKDSPEYKVLLYQEEAKQKSAIERRAWAYAAKTMRILEREYGVNLKEVFPSIDALKTYINHYLDSHREDYQWIAEIDPKFLDTLGKLFDRWKY